MMMMMITKKHTEKKVIPQFQFIVKDILQPAGQTSPPLTSYTQTQTLDCEFREQRTNRRPKSTEHIHTGKERHQTPRCTADWQLTKKLQETKSGNCVEAEEEADDDDEDEESVWKLKLREAHEETS